jgi:hypothetical protein
VSSGRSGDNHRGHQHPFGPRGATKVGNASRPDSSGRSPCRFTGRARANRDRPDGRTWRTPDRNAVCDAPEERAVSASICDAPEERTASASICDAPEERTASASMAGQSAPATSPVTVSVSKGPTLADCVPLNRPGAMGVGSNDRRRPNDVIQPNPFHGADRGLGSDPDASPSARLRTQ